MKNFWNNERTTFHSLPSEGKFKIEQFLLATAFIVTMFIGLGNLPMFYVILKTKTETDGNILHLMQDLSAAIGENNLLILLIVPFILTFLAAILAIKFIHQSNVLSFFTTREALDWKRVMTAFFAWGGIMGAMLTFAFFQSNSLKWNYNPETFIILFFICILLIPLQIACEELIFRSYLYKGLSFMKRPILQLVICGLLFGLMHVGNPEIDTLGKIALAFYIWTGIFLGLVAHFDNGLELPIGYHAANNIFAALIVTNNWQVFQTDALFLDTAPPVIGWEMGLTLFMWQPILLLFFNWRYKWGINFFKSQKSL